jgi:glycosyltransferase involved in cell wall biosynthesis
VTTITVFTPAYNSADTLPRVFDSLKRQSSHDFMWLVVDDGSTDGTRELVEAWMGSANFEVRYFYQPNSGKHNAHNAAVKACTTELFLILDADDELLPHAIELITSTWVGVTPEERRLVVGVWTLSCTKDGNICGDAIPQGVRDTSLQALHYRYNNDGERLPCFTTAVLRENLFPATPPGACPYIAEGYIWTAITRRHLIRFINVPCRIYHEGAGLSAMARDEYRLSRSVVYGYAAPLANDLEWFWYAPAFFLFAATQVARYGFFSGELGEIRARLCWRARALLVLATPVALALLARDRLSGRIARQLRREQLPGLDLTDA